jgi:large-conductance mechanosensitive channel
MPQNKQPFTIGGKIHDFLVSKSGTIMTNSFGMAIGFALKDFIAAIVINLFKPLIAFIFNMTHLNNYYDFNSIISPENNAINFSSFITAFLTFIMVIISVYLISLSF